MLTMLKTLNKAFIFLRKFHLEKGVNRGILEKICSGLRQYPIHYTQHLNMQTSIFWPFHGKHKKFSSQINQLHAIFTKHTCRRHCFYIHQLFHSAFSISTHSKCESDIILCHRKIIIKTFSSPKFHINSPFHRHKINRRHIFWQNRAKCDLVYHVI